MRGNRKVSHNVTQGRRLRLFLLLFFFCARNQIRENLFSSHAENLANLRQVSFVFVYCLEGNSGRFTSAKRNQRVCAWRRNSSRCRTVKRGKMSNAKSKWWTASSTLKSFSCMTHSNTTRWSASCWSCELCELVSTFQSITNHISQDWRRRVVRSSARREVYSDGKSLLDIHATDLRGNGLHTWEQYHSPRLESKRTSPFSITNNLTCFHPTAGEHFVSDGVGKSNKDHWLWAGARIWSVDETAGSVWNSWGNWPKWNLFKKSFSVYFKYSEYLMGVYRVVWGQMESKTSRFSGSRIFKNSLVP